MDWMYLFYFLLAALVCFGASYAGRGKWNEAYTSLEQTKVLQGATALGIALHHMAQKTCAPWHPSAYTVHGLDPFLSVGYLFVGVFLFCSGLGLYRSYKTKPDYLTGFFRRRVVPLVIAYYLSEFIYTAVRLLMGERMDILTVLWYLSGLHMANFNAWYLAVIPFFYLAFWAAFRFCRREGAAIAWVFTFTLAYTVLGACVDQQGDWWMQGEWWYNSILLFPLGLLFGRFEAQVTAFLKRGHWLWLLLSLAAVILLFNQSEWLNAHAWGYYGAGSMKVPHRLMSAALQWLVALAYVAFCFILMMKVRFGNGALRWMGGMTLEFYLMHGLFVHLFGYNFADVAASLVYIRSLPLYIAAVLGCSIPAALLFRALWKGAVRLMRGRARGGEEPEESLAALRAKLLAAQKQRRLRRLIIPIAAALALLLVVLLLPSPGDPNVRVINGREFRVPEGFERTYSDRQYAVWEYKGTDRRPANLILDAEIRDGIAGDFSTAEEVLEQCAWLQDAELYVNPQGVRMVRGFVDYSGVPERRYYVESDKHVVLLCMREDARYYSIEDCEAAMAEVADSIHVVG